MYPLKFFILEMKVYPLFQAGKILALRAKKTSVPSVDQRSVCFVCVVQKKLAKWSEGMLG